MIFLINDVWAIHVEQCAAVMPKSECTKKNKKTDKSTIQQYMSAESKRLGLVSCRWQGKGKTEWRACKENRGSSLRVSGCCKTGEMCRGGLGAWSCCFSAVGGGAWRRALNLWYVVGDEANASWNKSFDQMELLRKAVFGSHLSKEKRPRKRRLAVHITLNKT
jgi:hypothetical protein